MKKIRMKLIVFPENSAQHDVRLSVLLWAFLPKKVSVQLQLHGKLKCPGPGIFLGGEGVVGVSHPEQILSCASAQHLKNSKWHMYLCVTGN